VWYGVLQGRRPKKKPSTTETYSYCHRVLTTVCAVYCRRKTTKKLDGTENEDDTSEDSEDDDDRDDGVVSERGGGKGGGAGEGGKELPEDHPDYVPPWFR